MMWLQQNNGLHLLEPDMLASYSKRMLVDKDTMQQISNVTQNGFFVMAASDMLEIADGVATLPSSDELASEQDQLQKILGSDHVQKLVNTIESVSDNQESVLKLVTIVWGKEPRLKLSNSISKPRKSKVESDIVETTAIVADETIPVAKFAPAQNDVRTTCGENHLTVNSVGENLATAAIGTKKITSFYSLNGVLDNSTDMENSSNDATTVSARAVSTDFPTTLPKSSSLMDVNGSLFKIALTFDQILVTSTNIVRAISNTQALQMTIKARHANSLLKRLRFLRFLLENLSLSPLTVLNNFEETEWYDMFQCVFLLKCNNVNACNTGGDGYCMTRAGHQLKCRQDSDFQLSINEMRAIDEQSNHKSTPTSSNLLLSFVKDLPCLLKDERANKMTLLAVIGEFKWFAFKAKLRMMEALLTIRAPGHPLEQMFWGDAQTVTMLGFNATCVSSLVGDDFIDWIPSARNKWVKYEASSVPAARTMESWKRSNTTLSDLDTVTEQDLNLMLYRKPHFSVCSHTSSRAEVGAEFRGLKTKCMELVLKRIAVCVEMTPDILIQLINIIDKCEGKSQSVDYGYFDCEQFGKTLKNRFPDSVKLQPDLLIDFSADDDGQGTDIDKRIYELKHELDLSNDKVSLLSPIFFVTVTF